MSEPRQPLSEWQGAFLFLTGLLFLGLIIVMANNETRARFDRLDEALGIEAAP